MVDTIKINILIDIIICILNTNVTIRHGWPWRDSKSRPFAPHARTLPRHQMTPIRISPLGKPSRNQPSLCHVTYLAARVDLVPRSRWQYQWLSLYPSAPRDKGHKPILPTAPFVTIRHGCPWRDSKSRPFAPHTRTLPHHQ